MIIAPVPVYQLDFLTKTAAKTAEVFFLRPDAAPTHLPIDLPYRSNYYKIGICLRGRATLKVNLETYAIELGSLMLLLPYVIKQWPAMSTDFEGLSVFFTREFTTAHNSLNPDIFVFSSGTPAT